MGHKSVLPQTINLNGNVITEIFNYAHLYNGSTHYKIFLPATKIIEQNFKINLDGILEHLSTNERLGINLHLYLQRVMKIIKTLPKIMVRLEEERKKFEENKENCIHSKYFVFAVCFYRYVHDPNQEIYISYGINFENMIYMALHAEQLAISNAKLESTTPKIIIESIIVVSPNNQPTLPCGFCRQLMAEHSPLNYPIIIVGCNYLMTEIIVDWLIRLLPDQFPTPEQAEFLRGETETLEKDDKPSEKVLAGIIT